MKKLLRFITCGSVDDGKSTLIGHILYDAKLLYADQEKALQLDSKVGSCGGNIDYSLLLDGLTEEREQGITIDVAYRYFTTSGRSFIVADTPGHEQYTRNMAVGASFADLAVILLDAKKGVLVQTRRHARICRMMGIRYFVFAVNKMDLAGYSEERFAKIDAEIGELKEELGMENTVTIPVSATEGDNVTKRSGHMPWYKGPSLLTYLEQVEIEDAGMGAGFYLPVQRVCRPGQDFRGFQGEIEAGLIHVGDEVRVLPENEKAKIREIYRLDERKDSAAAGDPVTVTLDREIDVSRGSVITRDTDISAVNQFTADILWMDGTPLEKGKNFFARIGTAQMTCTVTDISYKIDVNTGEKLHADRIEKNEIAGCRIRLSDRIVADTFDRYRTLGELILIDRISFMTCACGVVKSIGYERKADGGIKALRETLLSQTAAAVEFIKSDRIGTELLKRVEKKLVIAGRHAYLFQAEELTAEREDIRLIEEVTAHLSDAGILTLLLVNRDQSDALKGKGRYFRYSETEHMADEEAIFFFLQKVSSYEAEPAENRDYI